MALEVQIQSLIFSFVYGLFFSFTINLNYKYLFLGKVYWRIMINFLFLLDHTFLYFILLRLINHGVLHFYFFLMLLFGFLFGERKNKLFRRRIQKKERNKMEKKQE